MYISSINAFAASWLLLCLIKPLYSEAEKSYIVPYEINNTMHQSEPVFSEEQIQSNVSKLSQYIYHRNYQSNSVPSEILSKDMYPVAYVKENVTKSMPEYRVRKKYRLYIIILKFSMLEIADLLKKKAVFAVGATLSRGRKKGRRDNAEDKCIGETVVRRYR